MVPGAVTTGTSVSKLADDVEDPDCVGSEADEMNVQEVSQ